jgi:hypothetical protein
VLRVGAATLAVLLSALFSDAVGGEKMPDPSTGIIDGKAAILIWPAALRDDGYPGELLSPDNCQVHAALFEEPESETLYPCGKWFVPPPDRYWMWAEQGDTISAAQIQTLATGNGPIGLRTIHPMVPAGFVALAEGVSDTSVARFISLTRRYRSFLRSVRGNIVRTPVRIPAGRVAGGVFDRKSGDAIILFRPADVAAGKTVRFTPARPLSNASSVFVALKSPPGKRRELAVNLRVGDRMVPPDDFVDGGARIYGIWYAVDGKAATLDVENDLVTYDGAPFALNRGGVTTVRAELKSKSGS